MKTIKRFWLRVVLRAHSSRVQIIIEHQAFLAHELEVATRRAQALRAELYMLERPATVSSAWQ